METETTKVLVSDNDVDEDIWNLPGSETNRNLFNQKLHALTKKHGINTKIIPHEKYQNLIKQLKQIKQRGRKSSVDFRRNKKYALKTMPNGEERLFYKPALNKDQHLIMVTLEETYDIIHRCHLSLTNHGGRTRMLSVVRKTYYNITAESIMLYLSMCTGCKRARANKHKRGEENRRSNQNDNDSSNDVPSGDPLVNSIALELQKNEVISEAAQKYPELYLRAQVDLVSVTNEPNEECKYLMVYRNYATKFIHLRAMTGITVDEAAEALLDIFLVFGAPNVLQSKNGVAILKPICSRITSLYPDFKIVYSEKTFPESAFQGKSNEDILKKLNSWLIMTQNTKWQNGVKYIQHSLNTMFHETICRTPSELVFGRNPNKGVTSVLGNIENIFSESDLLTLLDSRNGQPENIRNNLLLTESLIIPNELIKLEVEVECGEENIECTVSD